MSNLNKYQEELTSYLDTELSDILTDEQREKLYQYQVLAITAERARAKHEVHKNLGTMDDNCYECNKEFIVSQTKVLGALVLIIVSFTLVVVNWA